MAIVSLILSLFMAGIVAITLFVSRSYKSAEAVSLACLAFGVLLCPAFGAIFPPVGVTALALAILCGVLLARGSKPTPRQTAVIGITAVAMGMVGGVLFSLPYVKHLRELRTTYPIESLASRLEYETKPAAGPPLGNTVAAPDAKPHFDPPPRGAPAWSELSILESRRRFGGSRPRALELIHASVVEQFVNAPGFGLSRMYYFTENDLKTRPEPAATLRGTMEKYPPTDRPDATGGTPLTTTRREAQLSPVEERLWDIHLGGLFDFFNPADEGLVIDRDHVAGFVPHHFSSDFPPWPKTPPIQWELRRLELVSLRRFGRPMVYATNQKLPQMEELEKTPTREPTAFESAALDSLAKGEELVYIQNGHSVLALGALRARELCTKCHEVRRGALLGAFSYEFLGNASAAGPSTSGKPPI
jgi:hypothetical protein